MNSMEPIREMKRIEAMKRVLAKNSRDVLLFVMGINTALRVSDLLSLTIGDVVDMKGRPRQYVEIREKKTGKSKKFPLNRAITDVLRAHISERGSIEAWEPLFMSRKGRSGLRRMEAWRILHSAGEMLGLEKIGTHTMRKTFGYHVYKKSGGNIALVQELLNHSSPKVTLKYIGISEEEKNTAYLELNL